MNETIKNAGLDSAGTDSTPDIPSKTERIRLDLDVGDAERIVKVKRLELAEAERLRDELLKRRESIYGH